MAFSDSSRPVEQQADRSEQRCAAPKARLPAAPRPAGHRFLSLGVLDPAECSRRLQRQPYARNTAQLGLTGRVSCTRIVIGVVYGRMIGYTSPEWAVRIRQACRCSGS